MPSKYAPPCVPVWKGDKPWKDRGGKAQKTNGGATAPGITADTITVVYYVPGTQDLATAFQALGVLDSEAATVKLLRQFVDASNRTFELYGRKVEIKRFQATNDGIDPTAARADAIRVATKLHAFASLGGPTQTAAYQDELAKRKVMCLGCGYAVPDENYQKDAPYAWGQLATPDQLVNGVFDFGTRNLFGKPARFAGDAKMRTRTRSFGVVHYEQDPPVFEALAKKTEAKYAKQGYTARIILTYLLKLDTLSSQAQTIIGKLKAAGVTSVVFLGDPLMPKYLTEQATKQDYFPEWIVTGTVFTDATAAGRLYDQKQWAHAFGTSALPARTKPQDLEPWRIYKWYFGKDPEAQKSIGLVGPVVEQLYLGMQLAGPDLSAQTYAGGMFRFPASGGGPTTPRISFGFHGLFPNADYVGVDDFTPIWWDPDASGLDEQNRQGKGMWRYPGGGRRYLLGAVPRLSDELLFKKGNAPAVLPRVPNVDQPPDYPPWPGSPADK